MADPRLSCNNNILQIELYANIRIYLWAFSHSSCIQIYHINALYHKSTSFFHYVVVFFEYEVEIVTAGSMNVMSVCLFPADILRCLLRIVTILSSQWHDYLPQWYQIRPVPGGTLLFVWYTWCTPVYR
jgi:hypothetical protein